MRPLRPRVREVQSDFARQHRQRAGIEGTISAGVRALHLSRARYIGPAKTHLQHGLTAAAMNLIRLEARLGGTPLARTRRSAFTRLMALPTGTSCIHQQYQDEGGSRLEWLPDWTPIGLCNG
jgi:hypothetical protein